jgi:hypothetical protein
LDEYLHFKELIKIEEQLFTSVENSIIFIISSYIKSKEFVDVFPNLHIVLRMFFSITVANRTDERAFSVLKRVKKYLQSSEARLNALLNIENELLNYINLNDLINNFCSKKVKINKLQTTNVAISMHFKCISIYWFQK